MTGSIKGVAEIVINVRDLSAMTDFYQTALGFAVYSLFPETEPTLVFLTIADLDSPLGRGGHPQLFALLDPKRHIFTADGYVGLYNQRRKPVKRRAGDPDESTRWLALHKVDLDLTHQIQSLPLATELAHAPFPAIAAHESIRVDGPGGTLVFRHFTTARTVASRSESGESNLLQRCREQPRRLDADLGPQSLGPYTPPTQE